MSQKFAVTDDVHLEALDQHEAQDPLVYIVFEDYPERQTIPIFAHEIRLLTAALVDAVTWIADQAK